MEANSKMKAPVCPQVPVATAESPSVSDTAQRNELPPQNSKCAFACRSPECAAKSGCRSHSSGGWWVKYIIRKKQWRAGLRLSPVILRMQGLVTWHILLVCYTKHMHEVSLKRTNASAVVWKLRKLIVQKQMNNHQLQDRFSDKFVVYSFAFSFNLLFLFFSMKSEWGDVNVTILTTRYVYMCNTFFKCNIRSTHRLFQWKWCCG
jgi:hypothetical protein